MKKFWSFLIMLLFVVGLVACGGGGGGNGGGGNGGDGGNGGGNDEIKLNRVGFDGKGMKVIIKVYPKYEHDPSDPDYSGTYRQQRYQHLTNVEKAYKIDIEYVDYTDSEPWGPDRAQAIENGHINGSRIGDIYQIASEWIPKLAKAHAIAPLYDPAKDEGYFEKYGYEQAKVLSDISSYKKLVYGYIPGQSRPDYFMYFNADLVEKLGLKNPAQMWLDGEWNWSNFVEYLDDARNSSQWNSSYVQMSGQQTEMLIGVVSARGGKFVLPQNNLLLWTTEDVLEPIDQLKALYNKGYIEKANHDVSSKFATGNAIFATGGLWFVGSEMRFASSFGFEIGAVPYPVADGDEGVLAKYSVPVYASSAFAVANVQNGENGLNSEVLFNILDDLYSRFESPAEDIDPDEAYELWLETKFSNQLYIDAIMSVQDPKYQYFEKIFLASMSAGAQGASHYGGDALYPKINGIFAGNDARSVFEEITVLYQGILADIS